MSEGEGRNDRRKNSLKGSPYVVVTECDHRGHPKRCKKSDNGFYVGMMLRWRAKGAFIAFHSCAKNYNSCNFLRVININPISLIFNN